MDKGFLTLLICSVMGGLVLFVYILWCLWNTKNYLD